MVSRNQLRPDKSQKWETGGACLRYSHFVSLKSQKPASNGFARSAKMKFYCHSKMTLEKIKNSEIFEIFDFLCNFRFFEDCKNLRKFHKSEICLKSLRCTCHFKNDVIFPKKFVKT